MRNYEGRVIKVKSFKLNIDIPEAAEAAAILKAVYVAIEDGYLSICCESDAKAVIQSLNHPINASSYWSISGFINKILDLRSFFHFICFACVPRNNNKFAHIVSRWDLLNVHSVGLHHLLYSGYFAEVLNQESGSTATTWFGALCCCIFASFFG